MADPAELEGQRISAEQRTRDIAFNDGIEAGASAIEHDGRFDAQTVGEVIAVLYSCKRDTRIIVEPVPVKEAGCKTTRVRPNPPIIPPREPVPEAYPPQGMTWSAAEQLR